MEDFYKIRKPRGFWTLEKCINDALQYNSKKEWREKSSAYDTVRRNGWIKNCEPFILNSKNPNNYWTKELCISEALRYKTKTNWAIKSPSSYGASINNGWIDECSQHMFKLGSRFERLIYAFEFLDKSVYVGLTYNSLIRRNAHLNNPQSQVYKYIQESKLQPKFIELTNYLDIHAASEKEHEFVEQYRMDGWNILNKTKTGALGSTILKWNKENCIKEAQKFSLKTEWKYKSSGSYKSAIKNNWYLECCKYIGYGKYL